MNQKRNEKYNNTYEMQNGRKINIKHAKKK